MPVQRIEGIKIGKEEQGEFAGGYIYGANFTLGGTEGPSKLTISVVNEGLGWAEDTSQKKRIIKQYMGLRTGEVHKNFSIESSDIYKIKIGSIKLAMNLVGFSEEKSPELHTLNYEFVDTSHILDRVFVGLANRHQLANAKERAYLIDNLNAMCPNCITGINNREVNASMIALRDAALSVDSWEFARDKGSKNFEYNFQFNPDNKNQIAEFGGIITVGREEFIDHGSSGFVPIATNEEKIRTEAGTVTYTEVINGELPCDVPNVSYKFVDVLAAVSQMGIEITGLPKRWEKNGIKNDYRQAYTGTLREVLSSWCADFGYSFVWGFLPEKGNKIVKTLNFIDLSTGTKNYLAEVKDIIENYQIASVTKGMPATPFLVKNISYSASMMNTYSSNYLSYYLKPHRPKTYNPYAYYDLRFHCLRIDEVFTPAACGMPGKWVDGNQQWTKRDIVHFLISCSLAKFDSTARTIYNAYIGRWWAIGIQPTYKFTRREADHLFQYIKSENLNSILREWHYEQENDSIEMRPANFVDAYVGYENADLAGEWEAFERAIADEFLGQHYVINPSVQADFDLSEFETCSPVLNMKQSVEMTPNAERLFSKTDVPWVNIASRSPASKAGAQSVQSGWLKEAFVKRLYYVHVNASWGTLQDHVDFALHGNDDSESSADTGSGFKDLEKGIVWMDNLMIDSALWNEMYSADKALQEDPEAQLGPTELGGPVKAMDAARTASFNGSSSSDHDPSAEETLYYKNPYSDRGSVYKKHEHPKFFVFAPDFITRFGVDDGLGFMAWTGKDPVTGEIEKGMAINRLQEVGKREPIADTECSIRCESSLIETLCRCPTDMEIASQYFVGLPFNPDHGGLLCPSFSLRGPHGTVKIVLPYNSMAAAFDDADNQWKSYWGYAKKSVDVKLLLEGKKLVLGDDQRANNTGENSNLSALPKNTMSIRVNANDITNDADTVFGALNSSDKPADAPAQLIKVIVPTDSGTDKQGGEEMMTLNDYHNRIRDHFNKENTDVTQPSQTLNFSILGTKYDILHGDKNLKSYLTPEKGLTEFNISLGSEGLATSFTFETRPKTLPKLDATMKKIGPTVWKSWYK